MFKERKTSAIAVEDLGDIVALDTGSKRIYVGFLKVISRIHSEEDALNLAECLRSFVIALSSRAKTRKFYSVVTDIKNSGIVTYICVASDDVEEARFELEVVKEVMHSLTKGLLIAEPVKASEALNLILGLRSFYGRTSSELDLASASMHVAGFWPPEPSPSALTLNYIVNLVSTGSIAIGYLIGRENVVVKLHSDHVFKHIAIYGATGSGKSTTASVIAAECARQGFAVLIIDWHGEYWNLLKDSGVDVVRTSLSENRVPLDLDLAELIKHEPLAFLEILETALDLTPAQAHILEEAIALYRQRNWVGYPIDIIVEIVSASTSSARWFTESREALVRKLKPLTSQYLSFNWSRAEKVELAPRRILIFDVSTIPNVRVRKILATLLIRSVALKAQYNAIAKPLLVVVDEAHNIFEEKSPIAHLVAEVRKWRMGFVVVSQAPSMISRIVMKNTNTRIVHAIRSTKDLNAIAATITVGKDVVRKLASLKPGEALLFLPESSIAIPVRIDMGILKKR